MPLTKQQELASLNRGGNLLVSAAAGSGKTKVLVERLMEYLKNPQINLDDFLIITYTKAAAAELRGKIAARLTEAIAADPENKHLQRQVQRLFLAKISTVHGFCADLVREYAQQLKLSGDFRVADENECAEIRERVLADLLDNAYASAHENPDFCAFVDTQGLGRDDRLVADIILKVFDSAMCHPDPEEWLEKCFRSGDVSEITDASETPWGRYLMDEFFAYLDLHIAAMERCVKLAEENDTKGKVVQNLKVTLVDLYSLRECQTWDALAHHRAIEYGRLTFPKKDFDDAAKARIKACREACKKGLEKRLTWFTDDSAQVLADLSQSAAAGRGLIAQVRQFRKDYAAAKRQRHCVDFSDLEHLVLDLLWQGNGFGEKIRTTAAKELRQRFVEIMVDEYQDSNQVQDAIFTALTGEGHHCFLVGDVKQSIYQFRLADPGIFLEKYNRYVPAEEAAEGDGRKVLLSANFRSGPEVIEAVNHVFESCMCPQVGGLVYGADEALNEGLPREKLPDTAVELHCIDVENDTYAEESAYVAQRIKTMLAEKTLIRDGQDLRPVEPSDIVILLRSPGSVGIDFQRALETVGIRCTTGGGTDLLATAEIQTLRSILQTVSNPRQDIPLIAAMVSPVFGFTADELAAFRGQQTTGAVFDALLLDKNEKVAAFLETLSILRREARMHSIAHLIQKIFTMTRMDSIYAAMEGGEIRRANLQAFYKIAADYENGSHRDLEQFLEYLTMQEAKGLKTDGENTTGAVTIMSIHKSKGLEFPVVFLSGLSRSFNQENLRAQVLCHKELGLGLSVADSEKRVRYASLAKRAIIAKTAADGVSEEMRVLYVAMTRPQDRLIMTYATKNVRDKLNKMAMQMDPDDNRRMVQDVTCPGDWVLLSAIRRREGRELLDDPDLWYLCDTDRDIHWNMVVARAPERVEEDAVQVEARTLPDGAEAYLQEALAFRYVHTAATHAPSKQTATQRKGRAKDEEAAAETVEPKIIHRNWRKPTFMEKLRRGKDYGNAIHAAMQYVHYEACGTVAGVEAELKRLHEQGFLTDEQREMVKPQKIAAFFMSPLGQRLRDGTPYLREFKFSILDDGRGYDPDLVDEQVLLQGVVDCALLEEDGITVVDFKTDYVTEETVDAVASRYRVQVNTYADALQRIYEKPVKEIYLYFFGLDRFVKM